jgi:hypothetical protein
MKKYLVLFTTLISINLFGQEMKLEIIPTSQKVIEKEAEHFVLPERMKINFNHSEVEKHKTIKNVLIENITNLIQFTFNEKKSADIQFNIIENFSADDLIPTEFLDEAYTLEISENNIIAEAKSLKGIYYSALTLSQLVKNSIGNVLPQIKIIDYPDMKFRGISDDISRGQVSTLENFKRIIKFISEYKMNTYMPYMEDVIQFDKYPEIGVGRGALTKEEIREIVKFADEHFVEVIPIFQTLGHYENILSQKEFIHYADWPGAASLDVTNPKTYEFLESLLDEVFQLFPSKYFHMGADESYDVGFGNSRKLVEESSLADVHAEHYKRIYDICKRNNKEVMMYGDIILSHPEILEKIPKDIIIVDWHYFPRFNYPSTKTFSDAGFNYIVSPTVWNFNAAFPENFFAIPNIQTLIVDGIKNNSIGMINSSWGDFGAETFREYNLYGYAWSAQCAWNISESKINDFNYSFFSEFFGEYHPQIELIFKELTDPVNQLLWGNLWRHPVLDYRSPDWRQIKLPQPSKLYWMNENNDGEDLLNEIKGKVTKNHEFIELLEFTLNLKKWFILKQETKILLHNMMDSNYNKSAAALNLVEENIIQLSNLKQDYSQLWKKYNKAENLWMIEDKFDRLITYFEETKEVIRKQELSSPLLQSKWIYFPDEENEFIYKVKFKNELQIDDKIKSAHLQLIADTFSKLWINGKEVDSVYTKRSGSLWIEQQRIKLIDFTKYLNKGENKILVEARNYYTAKTPGINISAEIFTQSGSIKYSSNDTWKVRNSDSDEWIEVEVKENPLEIIAPNFTTKRKSWIER